MFLSFLKIKCTLDGLRSTQDHYSLENLIGVSFAMVFKRKTYSAGDTNLKKKYRTKRRVKDLDQVRRVLC